MRALLRARSRTVLAAAATAVVAVSLWPAQAQAAGGDPAPGLRTVTYRGASVTVPSSWPVLAVSGRPGCVRFDRHAVYLGDPSRSTCPPRLVGRTEAVHVTGGSLQGVVSPDRVVTGDRSPVGVVVTAGGDPAAARRVAATVSFSGGRADVTAPRGAAAARTFAAAPRTLAVAPRTAASATSPGPSDTTYSGLGFDACTAQPLSTMATWFSASPYKAANIYIGGASRGCAQPDLTADWVTQTIAQGWTLIPTYVGLQASCTSFPNRIVPAQAAAQGAAAADDAIAQLNALGLSIGNPVYFDMEAFSYTNAGCLAATQTFLDQWTVRLHARGYVSGVYSSSNTVKALLVDKQGDPGFHQPDQLWFARWNGDPATTGDPAIPDQYWADHQRIHQYRGGHPETWGGVTVNIDNDSVDAAVAPSQLAADGSFVAISGRPETYRMAGGAPIVVSDWNAVGGPQPVQTLSQSQFDSLPDRPKDGTFLQSGATGRIWRVVKGVATYVPSWTPYGGPQPAVVVDQAALDNAGTGGVWNLLTSGRPAPRMRGPYLRGLLSSRTAFSWFGGYSSSAVATHDVRWRKARWDGTFGPWTYPSSWQRTPVTDVPLGLRPGYLYCVSVRARNLAGQTSGWTSARCAAKPLDDKALSVSSGWSRRTAATFYGRSALHTRRKGATLVRTGARVKRVGVVATTCRGCGRLAVLVDGKRVAGISLWSKVRHRRQLIMVPVFRLHRSTITLRVTTSGRTVQVDGLLLSRR